MILGTAIAYIILRTRLPGRQLLDWRGVGGARHSRRRARASATCARSSGLELPFGDSAFTATLGRALMLAYAVRRLPYALRSCVAALQQVHVSLEEAAENLGAEAPTHRARASWCR